MTAYWRRCRLAGWFLSMIVLVSLAIGAGIGWMGKSTAVRIQDVAFAVVSAPVTFLAVLLVGLAVHWCWRVVRRLSESPVTPLVRLPKHTCGAE